jgi:uncharacterized protein YgbK (DUF1537 family)
MLLLGCIADDVTGATDLSLMLSRHGMSVVQVLGQPESEPQADADALVVALKTRTIPALEAVSQSVAAAKWLLAHGARQLFFKYCSTFDSTDEGNIGPVAEALLELVGSNFTIVCPAFPENGRTVYKGHLFIHGRLLSDSGMRDHPLTPMTDANLVRVMERQCRQSGSVGLVPYEIVERGVDAIRARFGQLIESGIRFAVVDALSNRHLVSIARACEDLELVTGGSAVSMGLPDNFRHAGLLPAHREPLTLPRLEGPAVVLAGSCSKATHAQVESMASHYPAFSLDPIALAQGRQTTEDLVESAREALDEGAVLIYSTASPGEVEKVQNQLGKDSAGKAIEGAFASIAKALVEAGVQKLIVAGGETSGAVAKAVGIRRFVIGPEIDPGVPWMIHIDSPELLLALKSGNFGSEDFFVKALTMLG